MEGREQENYLALEKDKGERGGVWEKGKEKNGLDEGSESMYGLRQIPHSSERRKNGSLNAVPKKINHQKGRKTDEIIRMQGKSRRSAPETKKKAGCKRLFKSIEVVR